jgi:hypothetical protein
VKLASLRRPKFTCSPSYADYRPKTNAVILLDMGHTLRGEHTWEEQGKGRKPNTWMWFMCSLQRREYSNLKLAEATMGSELGSSDEVWQRWTNVVAIYKYVETTLGISLSSYLYLKLAKTLCVFLNFSYVFSSTKSENMRVEQILPGSRAGQGEGEQGSWPKQCVHE